MTPSEEAMAAADEIDGRRRYDVATTIDRHFADVIRNAAAMDTLEQMRHSVLVSVVCPETMTRAARYGIVEGIGDSAAAAILALAAKVGAKNE